MRWLTAAIAIPMLVSVMLILPLRWFDPATSAFMLRDDSGRRPVLHEWTDWEALGQAPALAAAAAEDQRFADHFGLDIRSIRKSLEQAGDGGRLRGASTISQQVAKNLFLSPDRSFLRKGVEAYLALVIELCWTKRRIMEVYLNIVELGPGIYGVTAASQRYFGKPPSRLTDNEAALLAAVLPNPKTLHVADPSEYVRERQRWIVGHMQRMRREGWITRLGD